MKDELLERLTVSIERLSRAAAAQRAPEAPAPATGPTVMEAMAGVAKAETPEAAESRKRMLEMANAQREAYHRVHMRGPYADNKVI